MSCERLYWTFTGEPYPFFAIIGDEEWDDLLYQRGILTSSGCVRFSQRFFDRESGDRESGSTYEVVLFGQFDLTPDTEPRPPAAYQVLIPSGAMPLDPAALEQALAPEGTLDALGPAFDTLGARYSGKVRENFTATGTRTIVVTDRVSAFDVVLGTIPFKGQVLNALARHWFERTGDVIANHLRATPDPQAMTAVECAPVPVEFVVRGYLTGTTSTSIWRAYESGARTFCGHALPDGLKQHEQLAASLLTPSTKAAHGAHDESVSKDELFARGLIEPDTFETLQRCALRLFAAGQREAAKRGLILVDTKYELGRAPDGRLMLIDEIHTPDSSRYWYADSYAAAMSAGQAPRALDKEFLRRWLVEQGFAGEGPPPPLTDEIRAQAAARYVELYEQLTGVAFVPNVEPPAARLARNLGVQA